MARLSQKSFDRYRDALTRAHDRFTAEAKPIIDTMTQYFRGDQWAGPAPVGPGALPRVTANLIFADVKVMVPVLALRNPKVFVKPTGATAMMPTPTAQGPELRPVQLVNGTPVPVLDVARAKEALVNWRWRQLRLVKQVRRTLIDALLSPFGLIKVGYELSTEKVVVGTDGEPNEELEPNELITAEAPYAVRWSPLDFRVDPQTRYASLEDSEWVAFGWKARLEDVRRNPRFKNTRDLEATVEVKENWGSTTGTKPTLAMASPSSGDEETRRVQLWEIWHKRTHMRCVLADDHDKALEYVDWPQAYRGFPVETLYFSEHPDQLYGPPDLKHVLGQQDAYNQCNSMILNHIRRLGPRKFVTTRGAFDEKELEKLQLPIDGLFIETDGAPKESILPVPDAPMPVDVWQTRANFREDQDRVSGIADFVRGVAEKVDTATEAAALQANLNVRTNDSRATVEDFAERVSKKLLDIDVQTINLPQAIPVIGTDGAVALGQFIQINTRETLLAETDVEVEIGSMQPINEQTRKRDAFELFSLLRNDPLVDQFKLRALLIPAYREHVPDLQSIFLSRDQFEQLQMRQMAMMGGLPSGAPGPGAPPRPGMPPARPGGPPRPAAAPPRPPPRPPMAAAGGGGGSGPRPVPGPTDTEV
jgi:hypothetical protein